MGRETRLNAMNDKPYRDCMAEIIGVLKKYDMAGAITVVSQDRSMFKYHFPTWSCVTVGEDHVRVKAKREDFPSSEAQRRTVELSAHCIMQMRDIAANTFALTEHLGKQLTDKVGMEHVPNADFDPERSN
jgi:hypothetical protein